MNATGVSSPRVSKGCLERNPFGLNARLAEAALADARATDTAHTTEIRYMTKRVQFLKHLRFW